MPEGYLLDRLALSDAAVDITWALGVALLSGLAVTAFVFGSIRAMFLGGREPLAVVLRLFVCVGLLANYNWLFTVLVEASSGLVDALSAQANMDAVWATWSSNLTELMAAQKGSLAGEVKAYIQGELIKVVVATTNFASFLMFEGIQVLTALFLTVLKVFGPLLIAGGVFGGGKTIKEWFHALVQVLLWPSVPPLCMMLINSGAAGAWSEATMPFLIAQSVLLGLMCLATPAVVSFVLGKSGMGALAAGAFSAAGGLAMGAMGAMGAPLGQAFGVARGLANAKGAALGSAAGGVAGGAVRNAVGNALGGRFEAGLPQFSDMPTVSQGVATQRGGRGRYLGTEGDNTITRTARGHKGARSVVTQRGGKPHFVEGRSHKPNAAQPSVTAPVARRGS